MTGKNEFDTAIAALEKRRAALDVAIAELKSMAGKPVDPGLQITDGTALKSTYSPAESSVAEQEIRSDSFFQMSISEAARKYFQIVKRPKKIGAISDALLKGGYLTESRNFPVTVWGALARDDAFVKVKRGEWALSEWYPNRSKPVKESQPRKAKKTNKSTNGTKPKKAKEVKPKAGEPQPVG